MQTTLYQILGSMPFGKIVQFAFLVTVCLSFITLADPNCSALSTLCVHGQKIDSEPPKALQIGLGIAISAPKQDRRAIARGLSVIVEKKNEDNENAG